MTRSKRRKTLKGLNGYGAKLKEGAGAKLKEGAGAKLKNR